MGLMTREDMLRELELLPVWQSRAPVKVAETSTNLADEIVTASAQVVATPSSVTHPALIEPPAFLGTIEANEFPVLLDATSNAIGLNGTVVNDTVLNDVELNKASAADVNTLPVSYQKLAKMDWQTLQQCVQNCQLCNLSQTRTNTVFGVGDVNADWLLIGEAPGVEEDLHGEPFVGQAGKLLDNMLSAIQLRRGHNVYIANVLKCHPPQNREPQSEEVAQCELYLKRQIELLQPKIIIALGKVAAQTLLKSEDTINNLRGQLYAYHHVPVIVTYHPAYLLRNHADKVKAWEDLCFAKDTMRSL
jgi:DNA polymerase